MASYDFDAASGRYHIRFRYNGKPFKRSLELKDDEAAKQVCREVQATLTLLNRGRLVIPPGVEPGAFLVAGGKLSAVATPEHVSETCQLTLDGLFDAYEAKLTKGAKEANTRETERIH